VQRTAVVATNCGQIEIWLFGLLRSLLPRIEQELGAQAKYAGKTALRRLPEQFRKAD
jgi:hypothetical protein